MKIREAKTEDLNSLLKLYTKLKNNKMPIINDEIRNLWDNIILDKNHHVIVLEIDGKIVSSCVVVIIPNLTHNQRPYAVVENVITHPSFRNKRYATQVLSYANDIAFKENCYKIMLMTSSKEEKTLNFYERAGFNKDDKTAFIKWL